MDYLGYAISAASGGGGGGSSFDPLLIDSDLVPTDTEMYDVGRQLKRWRNGNFTAVNSTTLTAPTVTLTTLASNNPTVNVTATNGLTANKYTVNGGTDQQYLMADGSRLQFSSNSGNSNFYLYKSSTSESATPPAGFITYNNAVQDSATIIYISHLTRDNVDIDVFFKQITPITEVYIQDQNDSDNFIQYNVMSTPTPVPNQRVAINVEKRSSNGTGQNNFPDGHNIIMSFFTNGPEVDSRLTTLEAKTANQTSSGTVTTFTGSLNVPIMDSASTLELGTNTQTGLTIGRLAAVMNLRGLSIVTTGSITPATTNLNNIGSSTFIYNTIFGATIGTNNIDVPVFGGPLTIGTISASPLTIGRTTSTTNLRGLTIVTTGNITPATNNTGTIGTSSLLYNNGFFTTLQANSITSASAGAMSVGTTIQTGLTLGRIGTNTLLNGGFVNIGQVPYINGSNVSPVAANPRLVLAKYIMAVNNNVNTGTVVLTATAGGMGGVNTLGNEQFVGTTWRYKFNGFVVSPNAGNQLTLQLVHFAGIQSLVSWTYGALTPPNSNFNGEIILFFSTLGASVSPQVSGYLNFVNASSISNQNITISTFSPNLYNTTQNNPNNIQIVPFPSNLQYVVSNLTVEWLR
jgi:hypothetical protein